MKKPYLNLDERQQIKYKTLSGSMLMVDLECKKILRDTYESNGWFAMKIAERDIVRLTNIKLLGRDNPRKWYQLF